MTELECEIKRLEDEMDGMLKKSAHFKAERVSRKSVFEIEKLRNEIHSKAENSRANHLIISIIAVIFSLFLEMGDETVILILTVIILFCWISLTLIYKRTIELDTKGLGLLDMLIVRRKKLESDVNKEN